MRNRSISKGSILKTIYIGILLQASPQLFAQSLNAAVYTQLEDNGVKPCGELLGSDSAALVLTGALAGPNLCGRSPTAPSGGTDTPATGGTASPTTIVGIIKNAKLSKTVEESESSSSLSQGYANGNFFITVERGSLDRDVSELEDGYESNNLKSIFGGDYRFNDKLIAGLLFELSQNYIDYDAGGDSDIETSGLIAYVAYSLTDDFIMQMYGGFYSQNYKSSRLSSFIEYDDFGGVNAYVFGTPGSDFDATQFSAGAQASYNFIIGRVIFAPTLAIDWLDTDFDTYNEQGDSGLELRFHDDSITSLQSSASLDASMAIRSGGWVFIPQLGVNFKHEYDNDQREIEVSFVGDTRSKLFSFETDSPDRDWLEFNVGLVAVTGKSTQVFANYRTLSGHDYFDGDAFSVGIRSPF